MREDDTGGEGIKWPPLMTPLSLLSDRVYPSRSIVYLRLKTIIYYYNINSMLRQLWLSSVDLERDTWLSPIG
jgi:hypothetical protein